MNAPNDIEETTEASVPARGRVARTLRDGASIAGAIALYLLLQLVVLPRLGFVT